MRGEERRAESTQCRGTSEEGGRLEDGGDGDECVEVEAEATRCPGNSGKRCVSLSHCFSLLTF
jgi:hypothetical protein